MQPNAYEARGNRSCEGALQTAIKRTAGRHFLGMTRVCYQLPIASLPGNARDRTFWLIERTPEISAPHPPVNAPAGPQSEWQEGGEVVTIYQLTVTLSVSKF